MSDYYTSFKVVVFGDAAVGKTTLLQKFAKPLFKSDTKMTIGVDFYTADVEIDDKVIKLQIWDYSGKGRFRFLLPTYVRGADGVIFMYDVTNYSSLAHIDDWLLVGRREIKSEQDAFPIILVGGKADLVNDREVTGDEGINIARSRAVDGFIECSSKTGENVEEVFIKLTKMILKNINRRPEMTKKS